MVSKPSSVKELFFRARKLATRQEQSSFLEEFCSDDPQLRQHIDSLLAADAADDVKTQDFEAEGIVFDGLFDHRPTQSLGIDPDAHPMIGPYKVLERLGEGGMGEVFMAIQEKPIRRTVALKVIKPGMGSRQVLARFEAERQALAMMDHPNITKILDAGSTETDSPYFAMDLVRGIPITQFCDEQRLSLEERLTLFVTVCDAVQHAHQKGIIHRDLKPTNVLVELQDVRPIVKVIDFGIAKAVSQQLTDRTLVTGFHQLVGTPMYMSPEQAQMNSLDVDTRSDIYSLGVLLYELISGETPFDRDSFQKADFDEMRRMIREDEPLRPSQRISTLEENWRSTVSDRRQVDPRELAKTLRGELDWIVLKSLEKDRSRRYGSAADFAEDIQAFMTNAPVEACPPTFTYRLRKLAVQHRAALNVVVAVVLALGIGMSIAIWKALEARDTSLLANRRYADEQDARLAAEDSKSRAETALAKLREETASKERAIQRARANLRTALDSVDGMYTEIASRWISDDIRSSAIQREFLRRAMSMYSQVLQDPDSYYASDTEFVEIAQRCGLIALELRDLKQAIVYFETGLETAEATSASSDELSLSALYLKQQIAVTYLDLGDQDKGNRWLQRIVDQLDALPEPRASSPELMKLRTNCLASQASVAVVQGRLANARSLLKQVPILDLSDEDLQVVRIGFNKATLLSQVHLFEGNLDAASEMLDDAIRKAGLLITRLGAVATIRHADVGLRRVKTLVEMRRNNYPMAESAATNYVAVLESLFPNQVGPDLYYIAHFLDPTSNPEADNPERHSDWIRAIMLLASAKAHEKCSIEAEWLLGRASVVSDTLFHNFNDDLRHWVDRANLFTSLSILLEGSYPIESTAWVELAAEVWKDAIDKFDVATEYRSGIWVPQGSGLTSDYTWFAAKFPDYDVRSAEGQKKVLNRQGEVTQLLSKTKALAWVWSTQERWKSSLGMCERVLKHRENDIYSQLFSALCLAKLNRLEEAGQRLREANLQSESDEPFLKDLRRQVEEAMSLGKDTPDASKADNSFR